MKKAISLTYIWDKWTNNSSFEISCEYFFPSTNAIIDIFLLQSFMLLDMYVEKRLGRKTLNWSSAIDKSIFRVEYFIFVFSLFYLIIFCIMLSWLIIACSTVVVSNRFTIWEIAKELKGQTISSIFRFLICHSLRSFSVFTGMALKIHFMF